MAYIYKRGKRWAYRAYAGKDPVTGKDKQVSKSGFATKKDAELAAAMFERQFHNGEYIQPSNLTFEAVSNDWLGHYLSQGAKDSSHRVRKAMLKHSQEKFKNIMIQKITIKDYQDMIDELAEKYSHSTLTSIHVAAHSVFKYAHENNLIKDVISEGVKLPKKKKTVADLEEENGLNEKFLEKEELNEFLTVAKNEGLEGDLLTFTLLAYTGLRIGEMIALKWSDVGMEEKTLRVYKTLYNPSQRKDAFTITTPKTKSSIRTISIDPILVDLLEEHKIKQDKLKIKNGPFYKDKGFIFTSNEGFPRSLGFLNRRIERILKRTSITKNITSHSFRHTHTSLLIEANVHIKEIQDRLGHSDINTTMNIYAHMTKNIKKEASNKFSDLMKDLSKNLTDTKHEQKHEQHEY